MFFLTDEALLVCDHRLGKITNLPSQNWVTINQRPVQVDSDPEGRSIIGCPNFAPLIKPCTNTLKVKEGYSDFIRIGEHAVCLDTVTGLTDGTPPGIVNYIVLAPGQELVSSL